MLFFPEISIESAYELLIGKIRAYFESAHQTKAVVGLSGGMDSALVAALAVDALGADNVHGILMPSAFSSLHSVKDSVDLAERLGMSYDIVPIGDIYDQYVKQLANYFADVEWHVALENIQARIRGTLLMAYSNRYGALVLNTSNKSELSVGYGTLYGDLAGAFMVIGDLYKLQVYEMADYINRDCERIPVSIIKKAPSAELHPGQKDSDSLPPYEELDPVLHEINDKGLSLEEIVASGVDRALVERIVRLRNGAAFKVMQVPPVLTVAGKPLLPDFKCL
ncbi:MAG: NAD(+) synthase [Bacteroidales bacterium]|jgi:NAD+ synthase (glutamine-hydrolysing)|nr:NAD(+) synthase [Bacteroidales bacterium]